jgi:hypothetical protein
MLPGKRQQSPCLQCSQPLATCSCRQVAPLVSIFRLRFFYYVMCASWEMNCGTSALQTGSRPLPAAFHPVASDLQ